MPPILERLLGFALMHHFLSVFHQALEVAEQLLAFLTQLVG
mgnify:CR=1 FL=1